MHFAFPSPCASCKGRKQPLHRREVPEQRMRCSPPNLWWPLCGHYAKNPINYRSASFSTLSSRNVFNFVPSEESLLALFCLYHDKETFINQKKHKVREELARNPGFPSTPIIGINAGEKKSTKTLQNKTEKIKYKFTMPAQMGALVLPS